MSEAISCGNAEILINTHTNGGIRSGFWARLASTVELWLTREAQRRTLAQMSYRELADIGITPATAQAEADKPFWRA